MNKSDLLQKPPFPCKFKVGDRVKYTNDFGVEWDMIVIGFSNEDHLTRHGMFIHTDFHEKSGSKGAAWWCPQKESSLEFWVDKD